jgi:hypothetical protein
MLCLGLCQAAAPNRAGSVEMGMHSTVMTVMTVMGRAIPPDFRGLAHDGCCPRPPPRPSWTVMDRHGGPLKSLGYDGDDGHDGQMHSYSQIPEGWEPWLVGGR